LKKEGKWTASSFFFGISSKPKALALLMDAPRDKDRDRPYEQTIQIILIGDRGNNICIHYLHENRDSQTMPTSILCASLFSLFIWNCG
jgi:hypothetical protein